MDKPTLNDYDFASLGVEFHYIALRVGFGFPSEESITFPEEWIKTYTTEGLMMSDPILKWMYSNVGTCHWSKIAIPDVQGVMKRANNFGLRYGVAVSFVDPSSPAQRSFGSFSRRDREFNTDEMVALTKIIRELHMAKEPPSNLTAAELEALRFIKQGKLVKQIAFDLGVTEGAVKQRLKNAKNKLDAKTSTQAVTLAADYGLI